MWQLAPTTVHAALHTGCSLLTLPYSLSTLFLLPTTSAAPLLLVLLSCFVIHPCALAGPLQSTARSSMYSLQAFLSEGHSSLVKQQPVLTLSAGLLR